MSQMLLREINKYNNSLRYFSKNKKMSYSSTDIYLGTSENKKPIILNFEECRSATALYGCLEKIKIVYLNTIMQAIDTGITFTIVNTIFNPEDLEEKIKLKLSKTPYKFPIYNIEKEDLENPNLRIITRDASMIIHFHNAEKNEKQLLRNTYSNSMTSRYFHSPENQNNYTLRTPYTLMIMAFTEHDLIYHSAYTSMGRSFGVYNFFSNNELDLSKLANSRVSILLKDDKNISEYKAALDVFQIRQVNEFNGYVQLKAQMESRNSLNLNYKIHLYSNESYVVRDNDTIIKLEELKKFYE